MTHTRQPGEKAFRRVPLFSCTTPKFELFTSNEQLINYNENEQVLEIQHENGSTELYIGNRSPVSVHYDISGVDQIRLMCSQEQSRLAMISARLWVRKMDGHGVDYKVPSGLKINGPCAMLTIPGGNRGIELFGDKYFNMAFRLESGK